MLERANCKETTVLSAGGHQNTANGYVELKGLLGISHTGSESGSDVTMLSRRETGMVKEFGEEGYENEKKSDYGSARMLPHAPLGNSNSQAARHDHISAESSDKSVKMKFLCSFGGKILPRPSDGKLRYVGGNTRLIQIRKDILWQELKQKTLSIYNEAHTIKYQLPREDLDALVSVSCDEDLQNMMEEFSVLEGGEGPHKLRLFLFSSSELRDSHYGLGQTHEDSSVEYVVAINGMDTAAGKSFGRLGLGSKSTADMSHLFDLNVRGDRSLVGVQTDAVETKSAPSVGVAGPESTSLSSMPMQARHLDDCKTKIHSYQDEIVRHGDDQHLETSASLALDTFNDVINRKSIPSSMPSQYDHFSHVAPFTESSTSIPHNELLFPRQECLSEDLHKGHGLQYSKVPMKERKLKADCLIQQNKEVEQVQSLENRTSHMWQGDGSVQNIIPLEVSFSTPVPESVMPISSSHQFVKYPESSEGSKLLDAVNIGRINVPNDDDLSKTSGGEITHIFAESERNPAIFGYYDSHPLPQQIFHSERVPQEQAELLKSEDSFTQCLSTPSLPGLVSQQFIREPADPLHEKNLVSQAELYFLPAKPKYEKTSTTKDTLLQLLRQKELTDATIQEELESAKFFDDAHMLHRSGNIPNPHLNDFEEASNDFDWTKLKGPCKEPFVGKDKTDKLEHPSSVSETTVTPQKDPSCSLPEHRIDMGTNVNNPMGHVLPFSWVESSAESAYHEESSFQHSSLRVDIVIDINDRFHPDLLSDMFNNAKICDASTDINPLCKDEAGLNLNMPNQEPQGWSFFQNLAQDECARKDVSLMDQDCIALSSPSTRFEERAPETYGLSPLNAGGLAMVDVESPIVFNEGVPQLLSAGADAGESHPYCIPSQTIHDKGNEVFHAEDTPSSKFEECPRTPDSECEEVKLEVEQISVPVVPSVVAFGISDLQIIMNDDLEELRELGSGSFGTVYHGKWRGTDVAIKRIKKSCFTGRSSEQEKLATDFWREAEILSKLHHPNVMAFYGVVKDGPGGTLATVTEYMVNGCLRHVLLQKDKFIDRRKRLIIAMDAAFGMEYLHSKNIVHFDLKCDNLLVNAKDPTRPICKVGDFGLSKIKRNTLVSGGVRGTLPWMAPELLNGLSNKVSEKVDVFSFGIVMWEILTGEEPYANMHYGAIIGGIVNNTLRPPVPCWCDPGWRKLMEQCWAPDPMARPSFTEIASRLRQMYSATQTRAQAN